MTTFEELKLASPILKSLDEMGYKTPTPIQEQAIPIVLNGDDLLGIAQTGTGKTAAFCLPILHKLYTQNKPTTPKCASVLILTPTRELAIQIHENLLEYGSRLKKFYAVVYGGVSQARQVKATRRGVHILVATPGRLLDLVEQGHIKLSKVETFVLDEADRMLDMGFMRDLKKILLEIPKKRHNLFFSATMPPDIKSLSQNILKKPKKVEVTPESTTVELIRQSAMYVEKPKKIKLLIHLIKSQNLEKVLVFVGMKHLANRVTKSLVTKNITAMAIHGNKSQSARQRAIRDFADGKVNVLIATDIASRGIDIDGISHVINFDLPNIAESYVHRIGRTARAGKEGVAISLVTGEEKSYLVNIEKSIQKEIDIIVDHPFHSEEAMNSRVMKPGKAKAKIESRNKRPPRNRRPSRSKKTSTKKTSTTNSKGAKTSAGPKKKKRRRRKPKEKN